MKPAIKQYAQVQLSSAKPITRLLRLYQIGMLACQQQDADRVSKVLFLLNKSLDESKGATLAKQLARLYSHLQSQVEAKDFSAVQQTLLQLHNQFQSTNNG